MSIRSKILTFLYRQFIRNRSAGLSVDEILVKVNKVADRERPIPPNIQLTPVDIGTLKGEWAESSGPTENVVFYLHGGGYCTMTYKSFRHFAWRMAEKINARVLSFDYRLAPEHPFPAAFEDALDAYRWLLGTGVSPEKIVVVGDSAGGGLALAMLLAVRDSGLPLPRCATLVSPWADLTLATSETRINANRDSMIHCDVLNALAPIYYGDYSPTDPRISPVFGDLHGLPPILIQVGSNEVLRHDAEAIARGIEACAGSVHLEVWKGMPHVWHAIDFIPESAKGISQLAQFSRANLAGNDRVAKPAPS